ncbi:hypothetical protein FEP59_00953 [Burkholderia multivorans]|nr:hypothetical protein [Burkholderia multivorans]
MPSDSSTWPTPCTSACTKLKSRFALRIAATRCSTRRALAALLPDLRVGGFSCNAFFSSPRSGAVPFTDARCRGLHGLRATARIPPPRRARTPSVCLPACGCSLLAAASLRGLRAKAGIDATGLDRLRAWHDYFFRHVHLLRPRQEAYARCGRAVPSRRRNPGVLGYSRSSHVYRRAGAIPSPSASAATRRSCAQRQCKKQGWLSSVSVLSGPLRVGSRLATRRPHLHHAVRGVQEDAEKSRAPSGAFNPACTARCRLRSPFARVRIVAVRNNSRFAPRRCSSNLLHDNFRTPRYTIPNK